MQLFLLNGKEGVDFNLDIQTLIFRLFYYRPVGWVIDSITNNELRVHFCAYKYHTLLVKVEGII